jgi:hypothetical protein
MNYDNPTPIKITVEGGLNPQRKLELTMSSFADINDWIDTFKTILIHQTFAEDTVKELFEEDYDNISDELNDDIEISSKPHQFKWKNEF